MKKDWILTISIGILVIAGLVTFISFSGEGSWFAYNQTFLRQLLYVGVGLLLMMAISSTDSKYFAKSEFLTLLYIISLVLLLLVSFLGKQINGARSWFDFGFVSLQPADFVKISFVLVLARYLSKRHAAIAHIKHFFITGIYWFLPVGLIMLQPDFGTALVFTGVWIFLLIFAGLSRKFIVLLAVAGMILGVVSWFTFLQPYQKARIHSFISPLSDVTGSGYNAYQSVIAVGAGGLWGQGLGYGTQSRLNYLPEHQTDFVFASFTEEWGYIGSLFIIGAVCALLTRLLWYARHARSNFESFFILGYALILFIHTTIHIGMNIGVMPVTGLPMPFTSFGGSHIVAEFIGLGIVLAMVQNQNNFTDRTLYKREFTSLTEL